jgi:signal peptidase
MKYLKITLIIFSFAFITIAVFFGTYFALSKLDPSPSKYPIDVTGINPDTKLPKAYVVYSGSMAPAIKTASVVFSIPQESYRPGDIISFRPPTDTDNIVTHRIDFKQYPYGINSSPIYLTSGDANEDIDKWEITNEQIVGRVAFSVPFLGYAVDFAKKPYGFILLVIIPATIIIYEELKFLFKQFMQLFKRLSKATKASSNTQSLSRAGILLPLFGSLLVVTSLTVGNFFDMEKSLGNIFGAASSFAQTARLENKNVAGDWSVIKDNTFGTLKYDPESPTFNYDFKGEGLVSAKEYCLVYYADPWPGDGITHSTGFLIDQAEPDTSGNVSINGSKDIGTDLPNSDDKNLADYGGAKIWLIPCANYDAGNHKVNPWAPNNNDWLFETTFINYKRVVPTPTPVPTPTAIPTPTTIHLNDLGADPQFGLTHDYSTADVEFTYTTPSTDKLAGTITAIGLKPYQTYQLKLEGAPICADAAGNDALNEIIGYKGRWWDNTTNSNLNGSPASNDAFYLSNSIYHGGSHCITGYLVWDYVTADSSGNVTKSAETSNSYHVLWCGGGTCNTSNNTQLQNTDGLNPPGYPICSPSNVDGELERFSCGGLTLDSGTYHLRFILNEESFHQSTFGIWTAVMDSSIDFEIQ